MSLTPEPGDLITAFSPQPGRCFRMIYSHQLQADHCGQAPAWKGQVAGREGALVVCRGMSATRAEGDQWGVGGLLTTCPSTARLGYPPEASKQPVRIATPLLAGRLMREDPTVRQRASTSERIVEPSRCQWY